MTTHTGSSNLSARFSQEYGEADVADIVELRQMRRASGGDATTARARADVLAARKAELSSLAALDIDAWRTLCERAIEPNGYYLPDWELAVNATAPGRTDVSALSAFNDTRLIGLMPVVPLARATRIPLPALASAHPYGTLCTPLLDGDATEDAAQRLMQAASHSGAW